MLMIAIAWMLDRCVERNYNDFQRLHTRTYGMYVANDAISRGSRYQRNKRYDEGIVFPTRADCPIRKMMAIIWITFLHVSS